MFLKARATTSLVGLALFSSVTVMVAGPMIAPSPAVAAAIPASAPSGGGVPPTDWLTIPSVGLRKPIVVGWTRELNQGKVVLVGDCWPGTARTQDLPCSTTWIAGHYSAHGAPLRALPKVRIGDLVRITHDGIETTYIITSKQIVSRAKPPMSIFRQDLLLQCSYGTQKAWAVNGRVVATAPRRA